jgi:photosynthetic reaction center cytochrome c subunit
MYRRRGVAPLFSQRTAFLIVFGAISVAFMVSSIGIVGWIRDRLRIVSPPPATSPVYTNFATGPTTYLKPESLAAMNAYIQANPQPKNAQVLAGLSTAQIANYMVAQVSGGLKVDCSHCHNLANGDFASEENLPLSQNQNVTNKALARQMMLMSADLNQNWITRLPASVGNKQITCATCHNGAAANLNGDATTSAFSNYPADQSPLPDDYLLPLQLTYPGVLTVTNEINPATGKISPDLNKVQLNQNTMYHMNASLGAGCALCHNANYFPSNERPQKGYAITMLNMSKHINDQYKPILANKSPSCWMCHRGQQLPPGSANEGQVPPMLSTQPN